MLNETPHLHVLCGGEPSHERPRVDEDTETEIKDGHILSDAVGTLLSAMTSTLFDVIQILENHQR